MWLITTIKHWITDLKPCVRAPFQWLTTDYYCTYSLLSVSLVSTFGVCYYASLVVTCLTDLIRFCCSNFVNYCNDAMLLAAHHDCFVTDYNWASKLIFCIFSLFLFSLDYMLFSALAVYDLRLCVEHTRSFHVPPKWLTLEWCNFSTLFCY